MLEKVEPSLPQSFEKDDLVPYEEIEPLEFEIEGFTFLQQLPITAFEPKFDISNMKKGCRYESVLR